MNWSLEEAISYYQRQGAPRDQSALISLLKEIQQEQGSISRSDLTGICEHYAIKEGVLLILIKRVAGLRLSNTHVLELCGGPNCGKHTALVKYAEKLQKERGNFQLKTVPCMRMCGKGPNLKWDGKLYHGATEELIRSLVES